MTPFEFCRDFRHQNTRFFWLSCGVIRVILRLAVLVEHRRVTDGRTDTQRKLILALSSAARVKMRSNRNCNSN